MASLNSPLHQLLPVFHGDARSHGQRLLPLNENKTCEPTLHKRNTGFRPSKKHADSAFSVLLASNSITLGCFRYFYLVEQDRAGLGGSVKADFTSPSSTMSSQYLWICPNRRWISAAAFSLSSLLGAPIPPPNFDIFTIVSSWASDCKKHNREIYPISNITK